MNMKKIYKKIAKKHGVTPAEIERDMKEAIGAAYVKPNLYARCVPCNVDVESPLLQLSLNRARYHSTAKSQGG